LLISFYSLGSTSDSLTNTEDNNNQSRTAFNFANDSDAKTDGEDNNDGLKTFQKLFKNNNFHQLLASNNTFGSLGFSPMFLSAQLALAVQQQQQQQRNIPPNPFLTAYACLLGNPSLVPSMMSERLKASRFNPYNKPNFNNSTSNSSSHVTISKNISESENSLSCQTQVRMKFLEVFCNIFLVRMNPIQKYLFQ